MRLRAGARSRPRHVQCTWGARWRATAESCRLPSQGRVDRCYWGDTTVQVATPPTASVFRGGIIGVTLRPVYGADLFYMRFSSIRCDYTSINMEKSRISRPFLTQLRPNVDLPEIGAWQVFHCKYKYQIKLIERNPPPRGGFLFTMFPHQEPCVRGPPSKDLYQVLRGGVLLHTVLDEGT